VTAANLRTELGGRVDRWVDVPAELLLCGRQGIDDGRKRHVADDEDVDIAGALQRASSRGTKDQGDLDTLSQRRQRRSDDVSQSGGLGDQSLEFRKHRGTAVDLKVDLTPPDGSLQQSSSGQRGEFSLDGTVRRSGAPDDLPEVEGLGRMAKEPRQHPAAGLAEQDQSRLDRYRTHNENNCTLLGYDFARPPAPTTAGTGPVQFGTACTRRHG
jgi:hypothetical protein